MEALDKVLALLSSAAGATGTVAVVLEILFRFVKTEKPLSIAWLVSDGLHKVGAVIAKAAEILDKVLPQRVKAE